MNIERLRRVQESIADERRRFDIRDWDDCIAGHACHVAGHRWRNDADTEDFANGYLALTYEEGRELFSVYGLSRYTSRSEAIARIERLIASDIPQPQPQEERELVCV